MIIYNYVGLKILNLIQELMYSLSIEGYYYISGNLIVYTYVSITSCWGDVDEVSTVAPEALEIAEKRIELINETF